MSQDPQHVDLDEIEKRRASASEWLLHQPSNSIGWGSAAWVVDADVPALIARIREICPHYLWSGQEGPEPGITTAWKCDSCGLVTHDPNEIEEDHL
jgi:hypothetical protein